MKPHHAPARRCRHRLVVQALLSLSLASTLSLSQAASEAPQALAQAQQLFLAATQGDSAAIEKAVEAYTALLRAEPGNPSLMAKLGAATSLRATTTMLPWKKMSHAEEGLAYLDKALALLNSTHDAAAAGQIPIALDTRFTAASTFLALPGFFNRGPRGNKLLQEVLNHPQFAQTPLAFRATVWMQAGSAAEQGERRDEARKFYQLVQEHGAPQASKAQAKLKALQS